MDQGSVANDLCHFFLLIPGLLLLEAVNQCTGFTWAMHSWGTASCPIDPGSVLAFKSLSTQPFQSWSQTTQAIFGLMPAGLPEWSGIKGVAENSEECTWPTPKSYLLLLVQVPRGFPNFKCSTTPQSNTQFGVMIMVHPKSKYLFEHNQINIIYPI